MRLILSWAITEEREGSWRQCIIAKLFQYAALKRGTPYFIASFHIQEILYDFFWTEGPSVCFPPILSMYVFR